jgi:osmotically-inducible protein OsmY
VVQRIRSQVLGRQPFVPQRINVDCVGGIVYLRGEVDSEEIINQITDAVRTVRGVRSVESLLHVPGREAPNKEPALRASSG